MASLNTPPPSTTKERLHLNSILSLISLVNQHIQRFLCNPLARKSLHLHYTTHTTNAGSWELSDDSPLSNLYRGIKNLELAIQSKNPDDKAAHLAHSEKMLQVPALLDEDGTTSGIANRYIVCSTYFHLCLVGKLRDDEWQMTMHFLQSVLASPGAVKMEFAPELWRSLFGLQTTDEAARQRARRYKDRLMYYQVVSYGEAPLWTESSISDAPRWTTQADTSCQLPGRSHRTICNINISTFDLNGTESNSSKHYTEEETPTGRPSTHGVRCLRCFSSKFTELLGKFEQTVSTLHITEGPGQCIKEKCT